MINDLEEDLDQLSRKSEEENKKLRDELKMVYGSKRYKLGYYLTSPFRITKSP